MAAANETKHFYGIMRAEYRNKISKIRTENRLPSPLLSKIHAQHNIHLYYAIFGVSMDFNPIIQRDLLLARGNIALSYKLIQFHGRHSTSCTTGKKWTGKCLAAIVRHAQPKKT